MLPAISSGPMKEHSLYLLLLSPFIHGVNAIPACTNIEISLNAFSHAQDIPSSPINIQDPNLVEGLANTVLGGVSDIWPIVPVGGTFNISAIFCEPKVYNRAHAVQILVHGATYNKLYWSGLGISEEEYNWISFATNEGYATLAIDRIGSGNSSRPDPLLETQANLEAEVLHQIARQLRQGQVGDKKFSKIACVGHSLGSLFLMRATQLYPLDFDSVILTGWSSSFVENLPKIFGVLLLPASVVLERFANLSTFYLTTSNPGYVRDIFYGPDDSFDHKLQQYDFEHRDTVEGGELVSIFAGLTATSYAGPVHVINGEYDALFCSPNGKCVTGPTASPGNTANLFPNASSFTYDIIPRTGHCLNLHFTANETFELAHEFLNSSIEG